MYLQHGHAPLTTTATVVRREEGAVAAVGRSTTEIHAAAAAMGRGGLRQAPPATELPGSAGGRRCRRAADARAAGSAFVRA